MVGLNHLFFVENRERRSTPISAMFVKLEMDSLVGLIHLSLVEKFVQSEMVDLVGLNHLSHIEKFVQSGMVDVFGLNH